MVHPTWSFRGLNELTKAGKVTPVPPVYLGAWAVVRAGHGHEEEKNEEEHTTRSTGDPIPSPGMGHRCEGSWCQHTPSQPTVAPDIPWTSSQ